MNDNKWIRTNFYPDYGSHSISELNFDRSAIISETCYVDEKILYNRRFNQNGDKIQESVFDSSTGKITCIYDFNDRGQKIKVQQFDENEELLGYELREYMEDLPVLKKIKVFDAENRLQKTTVYELSGEEKEYVLTREELENAENLSNGDIDLRAFELAFLKYFQEYKPDGVDNLNGNWEKVAFSILSGNEAVEACKKDGIIGVNIDNEFVPITKENLNKLRHIPITVRSLTEDDLRTLSTLKTDIAITVNSFGQEKYTFFTVAHAFYVKNINQNSVDVKEPNNTENIVTYSYEDFLKTYNYEDTVLFIP